MTGRLSCLAVVTLGLLRPALSVAQSFENDASFVGAGQVALDARIDLGGDYELLDAVGSNASQAWGLRLGLDLGLFDATRLGVWAGGSYGGEICPAAGTAADGSTLSPGCYNLADAAVGLFVRQGLVALGPLHLGVEAGASFRNVPDPSFLFGARQQLALDGSLSLAFLLLYARGGAGIIEVPAIHEVDRVYFVAGGAELALGRLRPYLQIMVTDGSPAEGRDVAVALFSAGLALEL